MAEKKKGLEQTRKNLMDAFWELYRKKPIEKISIGELTERAGYNRGTFYRYFMDIYDLRDQMEDQLLEEYKAWIFANAGDQKERIDLLGQIAAPSWEKEFGEYIYGFYKADRNFADKFTNVFRPVIRAQTTQTEEWLVDIAVNIWLSVTLLNYVVWYENRDRLKDHQSDYIPELRKFMIKLSARLT